MQGLIWFDSYILNKWWEVGLRLRRPNCEAASKHSLTKRGHDSNTILTTCCQHVTFRPSTFMWHICICHLWLNETSITIMITIWLLWFVSPSFVVGKDGKEKKVTIMEFYRERFGRELVHLDLPCFIIGPVEKNNFVPMEVSGNKPVVFLIDASLHPWPVWALSFSLCSCARSRKAKGSWAGLRTSRVSSCWGSWAWNRESGWRTSSDKSTLWHEILHQCWRNWGWRSTPTFRRSTRGSSMPPRLPMPVVPRQDFYLLVNAQVSNLEWPLGLGLYRIEHEEMRT